MTECIVHRVIPLDPRSLQVVSSRSDEPFGSIASLSGTGDIACFPVHNWLPPVKITVPEVDEESIRTIDGPIPRLEI